MELSDLIIGAIIASISGITVPFVHSYLGNKNEKEKIAKAFYNEIKTLQIEYGVGIPNNHLQELGYLYHENGLYFALRKEMYIFDTDLVDKLDRFYDRLVGVNAMIRAHRHDALPDIDPILKQAVIEASPILEQLKKYFKLGK